MKIWSLALALSVLAVTGIAMWSADADTKPEKGMIIGEVVELTSYAMIGRDSDAYLETAKSRAEHGFPVAIIEDETGEIWIPAYRHSAPASHLKVANPQMIDFIGMTVVMQGLKYRSDKWNVIRFSVVSEY